MKAKQFLDVDFLAAAGAAVYAAMVAAEGCPLAYLGDVFASPQVAVGFAALALTRWAARVRKARREA